MAMLSFAQVKKRVGEHLKTALDIDRFEITSAKLDEVADIWRIGVEYKKDGATSSTEIASLTLDATNGEVREFKRGV
jgi:hypothetical protein